MDISLFLKNRVNTMNGTNEEIINIEININKDKFEKKSNKTNTISIIPPK